MTYPTVEEFSQALLTRPTDAVMQEYVLEGMPYVFRDWPEGFGMMRDRLSDALAVSEDDIIVVGSGKIGFSLSPDSFGRRFSDESDVDVIVVDSSAFDRVWMTLLRWHYPRRGIPLGGVDRPWATARRREVYWGWFEPDKIRFEGLSFPRALRPVRDFSAVWFNAYHALSLEPRLATRVFNGRLYRTWEHVRLYHIAGLQQIRQAFGAGG